MTISVCFSYGHLCSMSLFDMSVGILQALNNLGSIYVDCGKLDQAADCYMNALNIKHTRAHQGLARVYHLKNQRKAAFDEMTKLIEKAHSSASAYEKRSEYCDREKAKDDLNMATQLDPLRTYPYRYRAAGNHHHSVLEILPPFYATPQKFSRLFQCHSIDFIFLPFA